MAKKKNKEGKEPKRVRVAGLKGGERVRAVEGVGKLKLAQEIKEEEKKPSRWRRPRVRGKRYLAARAKVERTKFYPLQEAVALARQTSIARFGGSLELHLVVKKVGELATVQLPYFTGKTTRVAIATEETIKKIAAGKIDFDVLLATPAMMPKLLPYAKILGPRGLMPNPKNGTLVDDPQKAVSRFRGNKLTLKTERKAPVVHLVVGKLSQPDKELIANLKAILAAIGPGNIKKAVVCGTMGPGIKIQLAE